jgi:rSAM/selenodomain-associated transferase 2
MKGGGISIVVPALDEAGGIERTLQALQPWRAAGHELIVVDGGSRDDTAAKAAAWADRVLVADAGRARQMNAGAAAATGEILLFLHADTRLPAEAPQAIVQALADGASWGRFDVRIEGRSIWLPVVARLMNWRSRWSGIATGDQAMFVRRAAFEAAGGFPDQPLMEDIELSRRLRARGAPACLRLRATTSGRRWDQRGAWRTIVLMWRLRLLYALGTPAERLARAYR